MVVKMVLGCCVLLSVCVWMYVCVCSCVVLVLHVGMMYEVC